MTKIYCDTEFHDDGLTIDLISIGMIRDDGAEYYAVSADADYPRAVSGNPWLVDNVLCYLPMLTEDRVDPDALVVKTRLQIRDEVCRFVLGVDDPQLWAWYAAHDHVALTQLFGPMVHLPSGFPQRTNDVAQEAARLGNPPIPEQASHHHHALFDARHAKTIAEHLATLANGQ